MTPSAAAVTILFATRRALNESDMASRVGTVDMGITGGPALVTTSQDILSDPLPQSVIKHIVDALKFGVSDGVVGSGSFHLTQVSGIGDDAPFKSMDVLEAQRLFEICPDLDTADPTCQDQARKERVKEQQRNEHDSSHLIEISSALGV